MLESAQPLSLEVGSFTLEVDPTSVLHAVLAQGTRRYVQENVGITCFLRHFANSLGGRKSARGRIRTLRKRTQPSDLLYVATRSLGNHSVDYIGWQPWG